MNEVADTIKKLITLGWEDISVDVDVEGRRVTMFDGRLESKEALPKLISELETVVNLIAKRYTLPPFVVDINNYRREREHLITELAKAAARKVLLHKKEIALPAMNGYERRLVHVELASRPDVKTESMGEGKERHVIIKPL